MNMGRFLNGVLVGIGIGLLSAPMTGEEMRRLVRERYEDLLGNLPEKEQVQQAAAGLSQTARSVKDAAQQAATRMQQSGSALGDLAQRPAQKVKQTGQDIVRATRYTGQSERPREQKATTPLDEVGK